MPEAVTVPSLTMTISTVSEESLTRDYTDRRTHTHADSGSSTLKYVYVVYDFANKNTQEEEIKIQKNK